MPRITLLTDFGTADGYAAAMKGVMADLAPDAAVEDASHDITPGDISAAAWALATYWWHYPLGTIHVAVVDPGVGGPRRGLVARVDGRLFVAPDNGVLSRVLEAAEAEQMVELENTSLRRPEVSATFHGRDIFAPAAAHLARGVPLEAFGPPVHSPVRLARSEPARSGGRVQGEVVHVDRFGNLVTDVPGGWLEPGMQVELDGRPIGPVRHTYFDVEPGSVVAVIGSAGHLEIAVRDGSAARAFGGARGTRVSAARPQG